MGIKQLFRNPIRAAGALVPGALCFFTSLLVCAADTYTWNLDVVGPSAWNTNSSWTPNTGFPNAVDDVASLTNNISVDNQISLGAAITVGTLNLGDLSGNSKFTINAGNSLTFDVTTGSTAITRAVTGTGADAINAAITLNDDLIVTVSSANGSLTLGGVVSGTGRSLTKAGAGRLYLGGNNTYGGPTYVNAGALEFQNISLAGFGGGSGRNIAVAVGAAVKRNALDNAFLQRLVESTNEFTVMTGTTANSFDFSGTNGGANLPNVFLGNWAGNGAKCEYSGTLTPASDNYRLGGKGSGGLLGIVGANKLTGARGLIVGGTGASGIRVEIAALQNFTGDTVIRSGAKLTLGNNLALQNSALDVGSSGGTFALSDGSNAGRITGDVASPSPTFGGLKGSRNLLSAFSASGSNNETLLAATSVLGFTLNVGTGKSCTYSGVITNFAPRTFLTKTGAGTQILTASNTFSGPITVQGGTLEMTRLLPITNLTVTINTGAILHLSLAVTNVVTNLVLNGVSQPLGTYNSNNASAYITGAGSLAVIDLDIDDDGLPNSYELTYTNSPTAMNPGDDLEPDGLTNLQEFQLGTSPVLADTDGDGLNDGAEVAGAGARPPTNPTKSDTDGDGLSDGVESNSGNWGGAGDTGTNPAKADTDGDGLSDGVESNTGIYASATNTGSNPFLADTDADSVGDWYEVEACYTNPNSAASKPAVPYPLPKPDNASPATNKPVKVFILMGQSNMVGQGNVDPTNTLGTLATIVKQQGKFPNLLDTNGNWSARNDVTYKGVIAATAAGPLTVGQGSGAGVIGPELGFGHLMGYHFNEPVLVLKTSEGGKDIGYQLLPPGSQRYTNSGYVYAGYHDSPKKWLVGTTPVPDGTQGGEQYDKTVAAAKGVLSNFNTLYTNYAAQGYVIAGFGWFQGWNDIVGEAPYPGRYETNLANYIKAIRAEFNVPTNTPFVVTACGFDGWGASGNALTVINAQLAMTNTARYPEFEGNVKTMETRGYWRTVAQSPSDQGYHYNRNSENFMLVGDALGRGMLELLNAGSGNDYANWATNFPGANLSDPNADYDGDGRNNDYERIWGLNPTNTASSNPFTFNSSLASGTFSYTRRPPALTGLNYTVWTSTNLVTWAQDAGALQTPGVPVAEVETVVVTVSPTLLSQPRLFVRMRAE